MQQYLLVSVKKGFYIDFFFFLSIHWIFYRIQSQNKSVTVIPFIHPHLLFILSDFKFKLKDLSSKYKNTVNSKYKKFSNKITT